ncbi:MAG: M16 family metallopeptidase [Phycisphaerales bacterium]
MLTPRSAFVVFVAGSLGISAALAQDLPTDPLLRTGELDNGLRYIVMPHDNPPGRATVWIHMHTGSLNETDSQRGIAHYLEHMAFNGSKNFAPGSLVPFFQSLGMTFGRDQNAFTSFEQTTYQLSLPSAEGETLSKGLTFFADVVGNLSLLPKEVEAERGIIQEERRRSLSGRQRTSYAVLERMTPGSLYGKRITIGTEETIGSVQEKDFRDYYSKWYGASNATLIVVADTDPTKVEAAIREQFASLPKKPRPSPQDVGVKKYEKSFAIVVSDPEIRGEDLQIVRIEPARPATTTVPQMRDDLVASLGSQAFNRRMNDKVSRGGTSFLNARVSQSNDAALYSAELSARAQPGKWKEALNEIALELQRARAFGFTAHELESVRKEMISGAERAVETRKTAQASQLIGRINNDVASGEPTMSPEQRLELMRSLLPTITPEEVASRFAKEFEPSAVAFIATLPSGDSVPSEAELLDVGTRALAVKPAAELEEVRAATLLAKLPEAGTTVESTVHTASAIWSSWLSNNTRVHFRHMTERANEVSISIDLIGGEMLETAENRGITSAALLAWSRPSTKNLSTTDINEIMTGRKVSVRGGGGFGGGRGGGGRGGRGGGGGGNTDSASLTISGSPEELETGFQLAHLLLTEPKIDPVAFDQYRTRAKEGIEESFENPSAYGARLAASVLYPERIAKVQPLTVAQVDKLDLAEAQAWLERIIATSPIEIVVVGDIEREQVMPLIERYIGSLPSRERVSPGVCAEYRKLERPAGPRMADAAIRTTTPQAFVMAGFYGADQANRADARALSVASRVLSTRMVKEVREEAQLVYSIGASSRAATTYPGFGLVSASAPTEPSKAQALVAKLRSMYATFAKDGPTDEELSVAKMQFAKTYEEEIRDPAFWSRRMQQLTFRGTTLDELLAEPEAIQAITKEQVRDVFAKYATDQNQVTVVVKPTAE